MKAVTLALFSIATALAVGPPTSQQGTYTGGVSFANQILAGMGPGGVPLFSGCCNEIYTEQATLVVKSDSFNITSAGTNGTCGPSSPGFIEFTKATQFPNAPQCYTGSFNLNNLLKAPGYVQFNSDGSMKFDIFAAATDAIFPNATGMGPINACPYTWSGTGLSGLPCTTTTRVEPIPGTPLLITQAISASWTKAPTPSAAAATTPSVAVLAAVAALFVARRML